MLTHKRMTELVADYVWQIYYKNKSFRRKNETPETSLPAQRLATAWKVRFSNFGGAGIFVLSISGPDFV